MRSKRPAIFRIQPTVEPDRDIGRQLANIRDSNEAQGARNTERAKLGNVWKQGKMRGHVNRWKRQHLASQISILFALAVDHKRPKWVSKAIRWSCGNRCRNQRRKRNRKTMKIGMIELASAIFTWDRNAHWQCSQCSNAFWKFLIEKPCALWSPG